MADRDITTLLADWRHGDRGALDELTPLVYDELRLLAAKYLKCERLDHTLQSTALVHESHLRMIGGVDVDWENRSQFFGVVAQIVRRILVEHARAADTRKGSALAAIDPRQARIVELRIFTGLNVEETAEVVAISSATVKRDWAAAKPWLYRELAGAGKR